MPVIYPGRLELRYQDMRQKHAEGRDIREKIRREQMELNESKRRELAAKKYNLLKGEARLKAIAEEKRKRVEYEIQQRHLFPPLDVESDFAMTLEETTISRVEGKKTEHTTSSSKGKDKEPADPDMISPAPPLTTMGDPNAILPVKSSSSTEGPAATSGLPSPPSSTSTPPSLIAKTNSRIRRTKTAEEYQIIPTASEKYRVRAISSYFLVDRFCPAYATPAPDLKRVMELGVMHVASGGTIKGTARYHKDCCPNWPMPTTSQN